MASNTTGESWSVKVSGIPRSVTHDKLSEALNLPSSRITMPKNQTGATYYVWIGGFNQTTAQEFESHWSNAALFDTNIKCTASVSKLPVLPKTNVEKCTQDRPQSTNRGRPESQSSTVAKAKSTVDKKPPALCLFANKGECRAKSNECKYRHERCTFFDNCFNPDCKLAHAKKERATTVRSRSSSRSSTSSAVSQDGQLQICLSGEKCFKFDCEFGHPPGWNPCPDGAKCKVYECTAIHPYKRPAKCKDGEKCRNNNCKFLHPKTRAEQCRLRSKCTDWYCKKLHPYRRARQCPDKAECTNLSCLCLHPPERSKLLCPLGADCHDLSCTLKHPSERPSICDEPNTCPNPNCTLLHGPDWNPAADDDESESSDDEPNQVLLSPEVKPKIKRKVAKKTKNDRKKKSLKSSEQRMKDWEKAQLPILACRSEFCNRLHTERILIVTAETGSGKSTQLPQYAAEQFGPLVVCTQPRVVAALSLARRVADEYDGTSVGESVGYQAGYSNKVDGSHIMFMTDAALIRESQRDPQLKHISVLIIDEAHERSLNTDIVLGIAKLLLEQRPNDFYVVIASATIDPTRFLQFFDKPTNIPLDVKGRVFPVTMENKTPPAHCPDQQLIEKHVVPSVLTLYSQHEGHTLVFLPGQSEIERALRIFKSKTPDDCIAYPLYGSQTPEEQEKVIKFNEKNKRMVVFCTNVAETSLTIPNVRLVVDSGWAKEARYDTKRRLTVIETVRISRSSADQRKGRAGRTAPGHCVRLYADTELKRANIEPEILRSSLDLVLLQIIRLNLDPKTFPFMDQPESTIINNSIALLNRLQCISDEKITQRGKLFTELGLDPRFSAFILDVYTQYPSLLEQVVGIVCILSAPGTIFFMGGSTKEAKEEARMRVAVQAQNYKSDLLHLYSVFDEWKNAGTKQTKGKCDQCSKQVKYCICRVKYSNEKRLNNKILQFVDTSSISIIKTIKKAKWIQLENKFPENQMNILSKHLADLFPEQCGYILAPQLPAEGVCLASADVRANITGTSVFMQKLHADSNQDLYQYFVAMTITQLPSGSFIIERLHPVPRTLTTVQSSIERLFTIENISSNFYQKIKQKLYAHQSESWSKWIVCQYERTNCRFILWGLKSDQTKVKEIADRIHRDLLKKFFDYYDSLECGPIKGNFQSGLECTRINETIDTLRIDLQNMPKLTSSKDELKDWLKKNAKIEWNQIKEFRFYTAKTGTDEKKNVYIIFRNENDFQRAKNEIPSCYLCELNSTFGNHRNGEKESWGRELTIETPGHITEDDIKNQYGSDKIIKCHQINRNENVQHVQSALKLTNLPLTTNETTLRECLQSANGPRPTFVRVGKPNDNAQTGWAVVKFANETQRNSAAAIYQLRLCQTSFPIMIPGKNGLKQKFVQTEIKIDNENQNAQPQPLKKNIFHITLISREECLKIFSSQTTISDWIVDSYATVTVPRTDLYPNFQETLQGICEKFEVEIKIKTIPKLEQGARLTFYHGSPQKTSQAATMLAQSFAPMTIKLTTNRQRQLFTELDEIGQLKNWTQEFGLVSNKNKFNTQIEIRGPQIAQGSLMREIVDYSKEFDERFREHELNAIVASFFGPNKAASNQLQKIDSKWSSKLCSAIFIPRISTIIVRGKPNVNKNDLNMCENEVMQLLNGLTAETNDDDDDDDNDDEEEEELESDIEGSETASVRNVRQERRCVFCGQKSSTSTSLFRICGHAYCRCAAQALSTSNKFPLQCRDCQTNIHINDIEDIFNNNEQLFLHLLKHSIQTYLKDNTQQDDRIFCPNDECDGLIKRNKNYQTCLTCGRNVCSQCQVMDDDLHFGRTCAQFIDERDKQRDFLPQLFAAARKFVDNNWPVDASLQPIGRIDENLYLTKQYKSLRRFYEGIKALGHSFPPDLSKGFFAYHGCAYQAINPICQDGFDPKRRAGQAYGRGEYFGVTAAVSHGYAQKGGSQAGFSQMLIAYLLHCPQTTTHGSFCYVVDNPIDWTSAFNLPVLVVTYGQNALTQPIPFPSSISDYVETGSTWKSPFRWHWRQDNGQFEPCTDVVNELLEKAYEQWRFHGGPATIITPPVTRYIDDKPQTYKMDFQNNIQTNTHTSYTRPIDRRQMERPPDNLNWFYQNENDIWTRYESLAQNTIERAFQSYRLGQSASTINIQFPGRPEMYQINFLTGQQTNNTTHIIKNIKRE